ncbi:MAG: glycosyl hydrolase [Anaerolineales bacterium]|nr:glycosyl hydrolase [Anaerolineales bacterium]
MISTKRRQHWTKLLVLFAAFGLTLVAVTSSSGLAAPAGASITDQSPATPGEAGNPKVFLPIVYAPPDVWGDAAPLMLGSYIDGWLAIQSDINSRLHAFDDWVEAVGGAPLSIAGAYVDIETPNYPNYVTEQMQTAWSNGYTPFVNMTTDHAAYQIAQGDLDNELRAWAQAYADFSQNGLRIAFIAPLQEMNGNWVPYGLDPINYKLAYQHIQQIFIQEGVGMNEVLWTFAPNGWSRPWHPPFEDYYPGDAIVDVVSFSGYNFGNCDGGTWQSPSVVFGPYLDRMRTMAPSKPIFVSQTASSTAGGNKEAWIQSAYSYFENQSNLRGVIYFNIDKECDWAIYKTWGSNQRASEAYRSAVSSSAYGYTSPQQLLNLP